MLRTKRFLTVLLAVVMILQTIAMPTFALETTVKTSAKTVETIAKFKDFPKNSWSTEALTAAVENGLIVGTSATKIEPRKNLTRAEFAAIISRAFGATEKADITNFKDVEAGKWYYEPIAKAVQMGVMNGTGATTFAPNDFMKREDVILALSRVLFVDGRDASVLVQFSDRDKIDTWSVAAIAGMVKEGYVNGYENGTIRPRNLITREELAQLFHNIFKTYISAEGTYTSVAKKGSVIVRSKEVTLKDVTINGDLVMADGIGSGDFRLENVEVTGKILARGGEGTVYFVDVESDGLVVINDPNGVVNFHNYRDDVPFKNNLLENTPATFLERKKKEDKKPSSPGSGPVTKYSLTFYDIDGNPIVDGEIGVKNEKSTYKVRDFDVPTDEYMYEDGYEFVGWTDGVETKSRNYFISKNLSSVDGKWYPVYLPVTVTPDEYTITFVTPDGEVPVTKTEGEALEDTDIPSVTPPAGFTFEGWSTTENDDEAEFTNDDLTAGNVEDVFASTDVKLYPVFKEIPVVLDEYTITFVTPDGEVPVTKTEGEALEDTDIPSVTPPAGFTFEGWSTTENDDEAEFTNDDLTAGNVEDVFASTDVKLYPVFKEIPVVLDEYTITFVTPDGEVPVTKTEGEALEDTDIPSVTPPAGFTFEGWSTTENDDEAEFTNDDLTAGNVEDVFASTDVKLYPVYKEIPVTYTVEFKNVDGSEALPAVTKDLVSTQDYVLTASDVYDPAAPAGFRFIGWTTTEDGTDYAASQSLRISIKSLGSVYYAQFEEITVPETPVTYTVEFKNVDGTEALPTVTKELLSADDYVLTDADVYDLAKTGYNFLGWTTSVDGTDYISSAELRVSIKTLGTVYYAQFEEITVPETPVTYTVEFKNVDGTEALPTVTKELLSADDYVLTDADVYDLAKTGYNFLGWTTTVDGTDYISSAELRVSIKTLEEVYYAQFEEIDEPVTKYYVYFNANGGTGTMDPQEFEAGVAEALSRNYFRREGYTFAGWNSKADGTGVSYSEYQLLTLNSDLTVYAKWLREYKIIFNFPHLGTDTTFTIIGLETHHINVIPNVTVPSGYVFEGWSETEGATVADFTNEELLSTNVEDLFSTTTVYLYAVLSPVPVTPVTYTVKFLHNDGSRALPAVTKSLLPSEDYVLTDSDVYDVGHPTAPADYEFLGWTEEVDGTDYITSEELQISIKTLGGKTYYAQFGEIEKPVTYTVEFKYTDGTEALPTVTKSLLSAQDYVLTDNDVYNPDHPTAPADYRFLGWTTTVDGTDYITSQNLRISIKSLGSVYYAQFEEIIVPETPVTYTVEFKNVDGTEAIPAVTKALLSSEDYILTESDVYDASMTGYVFLGWTTTVDGTDYISSAELRVSIKTLGTVYYAQFEVEPEKPVTYTVEFKYTDGTTALATVTKDLLSSEDYVLTASDVYDVEYPTTPEDYEFLGWTTTVDGADYMTSEELRASIKTLASVYYAQFKHIDDVEYYVEHYLEQLDGTYVLDTTETFYVKPGTFVTATALATLPDGYEEENTSHPDRVAEGTVPELPETLTLKLFYDLEVITVTYMELGDVALTIDNGTEMIYEVKYGGTIDNFYDPADETKTNEQIKAEIANFIEYNTAIGYGKNYDDEYLYNEFEAKDTDGDGVADKYDYYNKFGKHQYEHEINFNWYVEDDEEEYVLFDVAHVFTSDLDVHSKVKKLNIVIGFPTKLTDEVLTLNVPYEETTRFLDSIRDALFINENIATFPDMTGLEDEFYDKLSEVGGKFFNGEGPVNEDRSINNTDVLIYFYLMMGGKEKYKDWLWNEVEDNLLLDLNDVDAANYNSLRNKGLDQQQALYQFFELKVFGETSEKATNKYFASKKFIKQSTEEKTFEVNEFNEFIMEKVDEKIRSLATLDSVIDEYIGDKIPEGLLNRLPMEIVENVYETRVAHFLEELDRARYEAAHGHPGLTAHSGIEVDVNLVAELLKPIAEFAVDKHEALVNKAKNSSNRGAELFYKYYGENPYASALVGSYGQIDKYFAEVGKDTALAEKYGHLNSNFNNLKTYKIESFENIYKNVIMPLSVETIDALLWYMDPEGGAVDFGRIRNLAEKNEDLILALYNHPNKLMAKYAEEGLPEDMIEYYNDLLSDPEIKAAVEKIDNKVDFDMMFFVEEKLQNATLEVYYLKVLSRVGVPVQNILDKYTNSKAYKELTHEDFVFYLDELEKAWATVDGVENYNATTDYVFENVLEKVGNSTDKAQASFKGFEMIITRFFADYIEQPAP